LRNAAFGLRIDEWLSVLNPQSEIRIPHSAIVSRADVDAARVLAHHAVAVEDGRERLYGVARHADPAARDAGR